ncbi:putative oxidoreductase GLYR1 homolog [Sitophilus oryzae]|uniref:Cytokine-like nuclear factor N-PAC n=1 Tax=Sitophilus oryzae TaxID=7048 RepID=A0A6J2YU90_SITOR|nr:putative oxidoreductase GLYR1 homolog [Sitophilus oryzae]
MDSDSIFKVDNVVWARMKSYPPWPARIVEDSKDARRRNQVRVCFFGKTVSFGSVPRRDVFDFDSHKNEFATCKRPDFKIALKLAEEYIKGNRENAESEGDTSLTNIAEDESTSDTPKQTVEKTSSSSEVAVASARGKSKRKASDAFENGNKRSKSMGFSIGDDINGGASRIEMLNRSAVLERPDSPTVDFASTSELLESKDILPSQKKFGFLGLGIMGQRIVKNLIQSGHHVNVWSRNPEKSKLMKEQADAMSKGTLEIHIAPCDVMKHSDIVFSCSFDPTSAKHNVFGNCAVTKEGNDILGGKGYVEMTGIDSQTSQEICDEITSKGGRYLEAQLQGSRDEAEEGSLVVLTAGDRSLFIDCQSCFKAMGKTSLYLGEVGVATKVYLILQLMRGIALVGLAEGLVLADRCGISAKDIVEIFNMTGLACPYLKNKANIIINKDFKKVEHSIQNMQKDIKLALGLSDEFMQPLMMASAANEVYKHSRKLGYDEHDCACIYMKARY